MIKDETNSPLRGSNSRSEQTDGFSSADIPADDRVLEKTRLPLEESYWPIVNSMPVSSLVVDEVHRAIFYSRTTVPIASRD